MSRFDPKHEELRKIAAVAALAAYVGIAAALYQHETRVHAAGEALAERRRAIDSELTGVSSYLDKQKRDEAIEERRETTREYDSWKEQSGAWTIKRWLVLTLATLAFFPVFLWGFQSWSLWARDKRLHRSQDE